MRILQIRLLCEVREAAAQEADVIRANVVAKGAERISPQRMAVWLVADFEALSCQVTTTFDTGCAARIRTAPAINYTACCAFGFYLFHFLIVN
ncbi:hypothetical protein [Cloacibacterium caeni]|uniref:hypothetical protein n=1 Tax=Cloacibacterium caeni TaxID=2004710 RepID=UPI001BD008F7|nr:hypothetical protein [Cloacibacterium caeni]